MENVAPRLSIGMPVYNGEKYLTYALDSLLNQTYSDLELIISDNASTDGTQDICLEYAARDRRVRYHRNPENIGAARNFHHVFTLSSSEYFAWAAHDDMFHREYMRKCIDVLDRDPSIIGCYSKTTAIDAHGNFLRNIDVEVDTTSQYANVRLYNVIAIDYLCIQMYGVMRSSALRKIRTFAGYNGFDRNMLAELCLLGKLYEIPEHLFFHRLHQNALGIAMNSGKPLKELYLLDPGMNWRYRDPFLTIYRNYFTSVSRLIDSPTERIKCYLKLQRLMVEKMAGRAGRFIRKNNT